VNSSVVVAVDGTSGSGKSSTCRAVAARLGLRYLDTGAQFRAMTWHMLRRGVDVHDSAAVAGRCSEPTIVSGTDPEAPTISVDDTDVSGPIRSAEVTAAVSPVSTVPEVRARLLQLQRDIIGRGGIVVEGRDIASVVWPQAQVKVFLSADPAARARRRIAEHAHLGDVQTAEAGLLERDKIDSGRSTAPLTMAKGSVHIDTTDRTLDEVVDLVVVLVQERS
jgi:CMP/dCMP kinase